MKRENIVYHLAVAFFLAVVIYFLCFALLEYRRTYKGPWNVTFLTDHAGNPSLLISQPKSKINGLKILFADQHAPTRNSLHTVRFDAPGKKLPFGEVAFLDTTFLPGTVVLHVFGHEIQLIPGALTVDQQDYPWDSGKIISLAGAGKLTPQQKKGGALAGAKGRSGISGGAVQTPGVRQTNSSPVAANPSRR